jgi:hypothetical protein
MVQTAIEWLEKAIVLYVERCDLQEEFDKAKQMEKQQIIDAYEDGTYHNTFGNENYESSEEYYKKTFKSE